MVAFIVVVLIIWMLFAAFFTVVACMFSSRMSQVEEQIDYSTIEVLSRRVPKRMGDTETILVGNQPDPIGYQASFGKG